ncbi:hypothetical protein MMC19_003263 [Ptychographa xylographoides]|nr:hypothetical protein [Ptychographa xylographoides]
MESSTIISIIAAFVTIAVVGAWVGGYLDRYQKIAQDHALDAMGENRASYGLKSTLKGQQLSDDKDLNDLQSDTADTVGGLVGKGGIGESVGSTLSEGL